MSWIVKWNGVDYDVDPNELTGLELAEIKVRTGMTFRQLCQGLAELDGDAIRAVFWAVEKRGMPDLKFTDYAGPKIGLIIAHYAGFEALMEEMGKALESPPSPATPGSADSPSGPDTPETNITL